MIKRWYLVVMFAVAWYLIFMLLGRLIDFGTLEVFRHDSWCQVKLRELVFWAGMCDADEVGFFYVFGPGTRLWFCNIQCENLFVLCMVLYIPLSLELHRVHTLVIILDLRFDSTFFSIWSWHRHIIYSYVIGILW